MIETCTKKQWTAFAKGIAVISVGALVCGMPAIAQNFQSRGYTQFYPDNLVVSRSVYDNNAVNVKVGQIMPPNCASTQAGCSASTGATNNGIFPYVFNNALYDSSFGITSKIYLDQITPYGLFINTLEVPNSSQHGFTSGSNQLVTSFSSKSEEALHLSTDGRYITFIDYVAPIDIIDVSNSSTPGAPDPTNPVGNSYYRAVAQVDRFGHFQFTETNAYSGNNGRAAILNNGDGSRNSDNPNIFYTSGNAGNGSNPQPDGIILGAGAQLIYPLSGAELSQSPGTPDPVASFSVTELGDKADKIGKDDNFRGMTVFNHVLYYSKGSGSNGVNTVYFVDTTGKACPDGIGLPSPSATLPTTPLRYDLATLQTTGLPGNMCILAGFPSIPAKNATTLSYPFGLWFADANTLYVADEGDGYTGGGDLYTHAAAQKTAGLQKWIFNSTTKTWNLAYTLQTGLGLGTPYTVDRYPTGINSATGLPWSPTTDGLRSLVGHIGLDGTVLLWAVTSTVSGSGDTGADPDKLVAVTDSLKNTSPAAAARERFYTLRSAGFAEVLRGVSFTPGTEGTIGGSW